jgi:hypothetical protein
MVKRITGKRQRAKTTRRGTDKPAKKSVDLPEVAALPAAVTVRMYRNILGDCFLLRFPGKNKAIYVLIDCGILQGMPRASERMQDIAADIARETGSHLDLLVVTHEHWDHLSGFEQEKTVFAKFTIDELWLAWTEDDADPDARRIADRRQKTINLLVKLYKHFAPPAALQSDDEYDDEEDPAISTERDRMIDLLAFSGAVPDSADAGRRTTGEILEGLKKQAGKVRYWTPGTDPIPLPGNSAVKVYVLGPPKGEEFLLRSRPKRGEVYEIASDTEELGSYLTAALRLENPDGQLDPDEQNRFRLSMPFNPTHLVSTPKIGGQSERLGDVSTSYFAPENEWRRIDRDWLGAAEQLALKLDSDTNNTSLVLAFALGQSPEAPVMLFPGDAQVGNWRSWQQYVWPKGAKRDAADSMSVERLLASTVLYKVGHHCSHNATLRAEGLELMTHRDLIAMIPVEEQFARETKRWNMPFPSLLERLDERTRGRVIRADRGKDVLAELASQQSGKPGRLTASEWADFLARIREGKNPSGEALYIEYTVLANFG